MVAKRTPAIGGSAGYVFGASGDSGAGAAMSVSGRGRERAGRARSREDLTLGSGRLRLIGPGRGFLALIGRLGFRRQRLAVGVEQLNLGGAVELSDRLALRLLGDIARRLVLDLLEGRESLGSHAFDLDDVPTE